jgi:PelA/Pel-15E family pectate lyase
MSLAQRLTKLASWSALSVAVGACGGSEGTPNGGVAGAAGALATAGTGTGSNGAGGSGAGGSGNGGGNGNVAGSAGATPAGGDTMGGGTTGGSAAGGGGAPLGGFAGASAGGTGGMAGTGGAAPTLNQTGNPVYGLLDGYKSWLSKDSGDAAKLTADKKLADNMLTWQLPHGGFYKNGVAVYGAAWNGSAARSGWTGAGGVELGTIDNGGTVTELMFLADVYRRSADAKYRDGARKALDFLLKMQYPSGGFPQVYPERPGTYSNYVTFNDDAMVRVMILLDQTIKSVSPLGADLFTTDERAKLPGALAKGLDYILAAQIVQSGVKTVWCAQHDPTSYAPMGARSYEPSSKSGSESIGVVTLLLTQPQTAPIKASAQAAIAWYRKSGVPNTAYVSRPSGSTDDSYNPIQSKAGATMWYRFYDLAQDVGFFSGRLPTDDPPGTGKKYDIMQIEPERRYGYQWGGAYGTKLFAYTDTVGY